MNRFIAKFPQPPTGNHVYVFNKYNHRKILSKEARAYREEVLCEFGIFEKPLFPKHILLTVEYNWFPPDKRKRDYTNVLKLLEDTISLMRVWEDDSQIIDARPFKHLPDPSKRGCIIVTVCECAKKQLELEQYEKNLSQGENYGH